MTFTLLLAAAGATAGAAAQSILTGLRRGATVHRGWCTAAVAALWALAGWRTAAGHLPWWWLPVPLVVGWFTVTLTVVDLKHRRLPNALTAAAYPAVAAATAVAATQSGWRTAAGAAVGAVALGLLYLAIHRLWPQGMGAGDVKLSGSQGAVLGAVGWPAVVVGTALAAILTLAMAALAPHRHRTSWRTGIPHGPALLTATYLIATFPALD
jgi:leader peptidase (prepilin peptidase)/N-methyltransferase